MKMLIAAWRFVVDVALRWYHGGVGDLAAGVTFWIVVSMPAAILALLATLKPLDALIETSLRTEIQQTVLDFVARTFTEEGSSVQQTVEALFDQTNTSLLTVSLAVALWSISRGFAGLLRALDDIYQVEDGRPWYHARVVAVLLGIGSLLISVPLVLLEVLVWDPFPDGPIERILRGVVVVVVLVLWASTIYHFGPSRRSRFRHDLPGAVVAAVMWWLLSVGFGFYVSLTSGANEVTAALGAALLALTWIWLAAQVLLIGGVVNFLYGTNRSIERERRSWNINGRITEEFRRIVVPDRNDAEPNGDGRPNGDPEPGRRVPSAGEGPGGVSHVDPGITSGGQPVEHRADGETTGRQPGVVEF